MPFLLCLPLLILACKPEPDGEAVDSGESEAVAFEAWTALGCEPEGRYDDVDERVGPAPWLLTAWQQGDGGLWGQVDPEDIRPIPEYGVVEVDWPLPLYGDDSCGLWMQSLG